MNKGKSVAEIKATSGTVKITAKLPDIAWMISMAMVFELKI